MACKAKGSERVREQDGVGRDLTRKKGLEAGVSNVPLLLAYYSQYTTWCWYWWKDRVLIQIAKNSYRGVLRIAPNVGTLDNNRGRAAVIQMAGWFSDPDLDCLSYFAYSCLSFQWWIDVKDLTVRVMSRQPSWALEGNKDLKLSRLRNGDCC
jgi:hypothetical protein